jgi:hypothetical protein
VYKVRLRRKGRRVVRTLYFATYESACEYCLLAGLRIKAVQYAAAMAERIRGRSR